MKFSRSHLPILLALAGLLGSGFDDRLPDAIRSRQAPIHSANVSRRNSLLSGDLAKIRPTRLSGSILSDLKAKIGVQIDASLTRGTLKDSLVGVNENKRALERREAIARIAPKIKELRSALKLKQTDVAKACEVSSVQVSRWEKGLDLPASRALMAIAKLAPDDEAAWWEKEAGFAVSVRPVAPFTRTVPVLRDSAAAGTARIINENDVDTELVLPSRWLPLGGKLVAFPVVGDSMSPILETGYIVLVDTAQQSAEKLVDRMVAARDEDGVTIKWLRKQGDDLYLLLPHNTSLRHPVRVIRPGSDFGVIGAVVKWIGEPPLPPKVSRR